MQRPLADEIRPRSLDEVVGQKHLIGSGGMLRRLIESGTSANMIFYGPSGTGKTTIANIIAARTNKTLHKLNATTASLSDVKDIIADVGTFMAPGGVLLYLDEIQYFNKKQQQSLLEFMENGSITLIASTTENPYFYVYGALLSRSTVFEFKSVPPEETLPAVLRALNILKERSELPLTWEDGVPEQLATSCGGDVRKSINACELLYASAEPKRGKLKLTREDALQLAQRSAMRYDKGGDAMYDCASALMKSLRGSDPDAALHYLARFLEAGDLITPCRRLLCSASEDVGLAYPQAVAIVKACVDTAMQLGLPEAQLPLAQAAILLATAPKSNSVVEAIGAARADVKAGRTGDVPRQLQNVHADTTGMDNRQNYKYPHDYPNHYVAQQYLPDAIKDARYYRYGDNKTEQAAARYWEKIKHTPKEGEA
ncbi:MAG: replication-associated recombination protein A [Oscillospiraceae bacterium]|nr:replication-associated recombination protein A [Oscillospiraceae bacterium]